MILSLLTLLMSLKTQALSIDVTQTKLLQLTGLDEATLNSQTVKALDGYLFYDEGGISCGLESYEMETFSITEGGNAKPTRFEVEVQVQGPGQTCEDSQQYQCYVPWTKTAQTWQVGLVECDESLSEE